MKDTDKLTPCLELKPIQTNISTTPFSIREHPTRRNKESQLGAEESKRRYDSDSDTSTTVPTQKRRQNRLQTRNIDEYNPEDDDDDLGEDTMDHQLNTPVSPSAVDTYTSDTPAGNTDVSPNLLGTGNVNSGMLSERQKVW